MFPLVIEEKIPLKQGLKQKDKYTPAQAKKYWREDSIKTRIETFMAGVIKLAGIYWREDSIKTRIET